MMLFPTVLFFSPSLSIKMSQDISVDVLIISSALWQKFFVDNSMGINKKVISITLVLDLNILAFLSLDDNALFHSRLCRWVNGLY